MRSRLLASILIITLAASSNVTAFAGEFDTEYSTGQTNYVGEEENEELSDISKDKEDAFDEENFNEKEAAVIRENENGAAEANEGNDEDNVAEQVRSDLVSVHYNAHVQSIGWQETVKDGALAGTFSRSLRMEAIQIGLDKPEELEGSIEYCAHVQSIGWQDYVSEGEKAGTESQAKRIEAIKIHLTGKLAEQYDVYYRTHIQSYGWLDWAKNDAPSGSSGYKKRMEAIEIRLVKKGSSEAPSASKAAFVSPTEKGTVTYASHCQSFGWLDSVADGAKSGTEGKSKRMEAIRIYLKNPVDENGNEISGSIEYRAMCQSFGWMDWVRDGSEAGTVGKSKRLEAIQIRLTDEMSKQYDVYYRVHSSKWGTLGWAKNGETAGTIDYYRAIESIQIEVIKKGSAGAPEQNSRASLSSENIGALKYTVSVAGNGWQQEVGNGGVAGTTGQGKAIEAFKSSIDAGPVGNIADSYSGGIQYSAHIQSKGWVGNSSNGIEIGTSGNGKRLEAVKLSLTGELGKYCDIYYRAYVQKYGWLGWALNGQAAGTEGIGYRVESLQIKIVPKGSSAPGSTSGYFRTERYKERYERVIDTVVSGGGRTLSGCYNWVVNNLIYEKLPDPMSPPAGYTREEGYAMHGVENRRGNCYCFAAAFAGAAKRLGYDATFIEGTVRLRSGVVCRHGWVEIRIDGTTYICDPEQDYEHHYGLYMLTYASAPLNYMR